MTIRVTRRETVAMLAAGALMPQAVNAKPLAPCPITAPLDAIMIRLLTHIPETATYNGLAALDIAAFAGRMDDLSPEGSASWRVALDEAEAAAAELVCTGDHAGAVRLQVARAILANGTRSAGISYGRPTPFWFSGHVPYLVTPVAGPHIDTPNIMQSQQSVATPADVEAWIEKLDSFGPGFGGLIAKLNADEAAGCRPPRILLEKSLPVIDSFLRGEAADHPLITSLRTRMAAAGLDARLRASSEKRAITALERRARPAYARLRDQIEAMTSRGRAEAGLWAQPDGEALYAANVRSLGDTPLAPADIHRLGLEEVKRISAELDRRLRLQGLRTGNVSARLKSLAASPAQIFADSEAGREELLDYVRGLIRAMERRQSEFLPGSMIPRQPLDVRRVPTATESGAPGAYYDGPSLDGSRPGIFWINLRDMGAVPRFSLPTLAYHEGVPGHHTQGAIALALPDAPLMIRIASFNAYAEGWALYAEGLAAELGFYRNDRSGDLGRLQAELFRAARLVVDTGIHHHRWTREAAIAYLGQTTGNAESDVTAEVERYMAWPGQALGYKMGQLRLLDMRRAMRKAKGARFDLRAFHRLVLGNGAMPLDLVAAELARA
jgi:uncharacterized protein (DUF885 family)